MRWVAITKKFWIYQGSEYARFLQMQTLYNVQNVPKYGKIISYSGF